MVVCKDNLGLSLSLSSTNHHIINNNHKIINHDDNIIVPPPQTTSSSPLQLNLMISPFNSFSTSSTPLDRSLDTCPSHLRGIDVNKSTTHGGGVEEDAGVSSPKSTVSTVSGKRSSGERDSGDEAERATSHGISDEEDGGENSRKKLRLSKEQSATLEESFKEHTTLNPKQKQALAKRLGLRARQVEVWFQNRRARTKLKQTEVDCEFLKGCYEKLTEENRRLQKEVHELRALKLSPQFYMHMTPPTTLTMCPSCERVAGPTPRPRPVNPWGGGLVSARPVNSPQLRL